MTAGLDVDCCCPTPTYNSTGLTRLPLLPHIQKPRLPYLLIATSGARRRFAYYPTFHTGYSYTALAVAFPFSSSPPTHLHPKRANPAKQLRTGQQPWRRERNLLCPLQMPNNSRQNITLTDL